MAKATAPLMEAGPRRGGAQSVPTWLSVGTLTHGISSEV